jgi:hypothetical protein
MTDCGLVAVRLLQLPLLLHERVEAHTDGLLREFRLLQQQVVDHDSGVPARLLELIQVLSAQYAGVGDPQAELREQALARGERVLPELVFRVPVGAATASVALGALLDEADAYCAAGQHLLMLATPPELVRYRRWYLGEFVRQVAGEPPMPWTG